MILINLTLILKNLLIKAILEANSDWEYFEEGAGGDTEHKKAVAFFLLAAKQGHLQAYQKLGDHYFWGGLVEIDHLLGLRYYQRYADSIEAFQKVLNHVVYALDKEPDDKYFNGNWFYLKNNIKTIRKDLFAEIKKKASKGDAEDQYLLAYFYEIGKHDQKAAKKYFQLAADQGYEPAKNKLSNLASK